MLAGKRPDSRTNDDRNSAFLIDCQRLYSEGNLRLDVFFTGQAGQSVQSDRHN